jgi:hypothetical protein
MRPPRMPVPRLPGAVLRLILVAVWMSHPAGRPIANPLPPPIAPASVAPAPIHPAYPLEIDKAVAILRDLRIHLDFDDDTATFASWPVDKDMRKLPADQIARGIRLGLALWASVLPDMRFRFVNRPQEANLCFRFGEYARSGILADGARAFLPRQWADSLDFECGRRAENRYADGRPCGEWEHNIIIVHTRRWAVREADFIANDRVHRHFAWIFDPARPHYVQGGRDRQGGCRDGKAPGTAWSDACVPFAKSPFFDSLRGLDLAGVIQHEFGHALVGDHAMSPYECVDQGRRPILSRDSCVRIADGSFSALFPGDGVDSWWNRRGVFAADAARLKRKGYRVSYPVTAASILMARPGGASLRTSDWRAAERAMIWPLQTSIMTREQAAKALFVVDVVLP